MKSFHREILRIVRRWKKAKLHEATMSGNVGAYAVPLGRPMRRVFPNGLTSVADYFRAKARKKH